MTADRDGQEAGTASRLLSRVVYGLVRLCGFLSTLLVLATLAIVVYAVVLRYVFNTPLLWGDELLGYLLVAMIMLGAAEALRRGDHISIDLLAARAQPGLARLLKTWGDCAVLLFATLLGWSAWRSVVFAYGFGAYSPGHLEVAMWIPQLPLVVGSALLALTAITRIIERFARNGPA